MVRTDKIAAKDSAKGVEGDPRNGRAELGKVQQDLKVKVAVAQIGTKLPATTASNPTPAAARVARADPFRSRPIE